MKCLKMVNIPPLVCSTTLPITESLHNSTTTNILETEDAGSQLDFQAFPPYPREVLEVGGLIFKKINLTNNEGLNTDFALSVINNDNDLRIQSGKKSSLKDSKIRFLSLNHEIFSSTTVNERFLKNCKERNSSSMPEINQFLKFSLSEELFQEQIPLEVIADDESETMPRIKCKYSSHDTLKNLSTQSFVDSVGFNSMSRKAKRQIIEKNSETLEEAMSPRKPGHTTGSKVAEGKIDYGLQTNCNAENDKFLTFYDRSVALKPFELSENEDEFGDFEEAWCIPTNGTLCDCCFRESNIFNIDIKKLRIYLEKVLDLMFPAKNLATSAYRKEKTDSLNNIPGDDTIRFQELTDIFLTSIEYSSALAFNLKESSCRCALIKSLGVDSRNVHVGKNWINSSFSFGLNTLPMKPTCNKNVEVSDVVGYVNGNISDAEIIPSPHIGAVKEDQINNSNSIVFNPDASIFSTVLQTNQDAFYVNKKNDLDNFQLYFWQDVQPIQHKISGCNNGSPNERSHRNIFANNCEEPIYIKSENDMDVVVVSSTFSGPLKETHIYSPPEVLGKCNNFSSNLFVKPEIAVNSPTFDQNSTSDGIVIDETVVRKEYRDVEYHPKSMTQHDHEDSQELHNINKNLALGMFSQSTSTQYHGFDDEFKEFQSAPTRFADVLIDCKNRSRLDSMVPTHAINPDSGTSQREVILSPAVLIPQIKVETDRRNKLLHTPATNLSNQQFFSQKTLNYNTCNISKDLNITQENQLSFDYNVVCKEKINEYAAKCDLSKDDDDWSDFVSVPPNSNFNCMKKKKVDLIIIHSGNSKTSSADDEGDWSEFIANEISIPYKSSIGTSLKNPPTNSISHTSNSITNTTSSSVATTTSAKTDNVSAQYNRSL